MAAGSGFFIAWLVTAVLAWPLSLTAATALAFPAERGSDAPEVLLLVVLWLALLAPQPFIAAWVAQQTLALLGRASLTYVRALLAMLAGFAAGLFAIVALPASAGLPIVNRWWPGLLVGALLLRSGARSAP